MSDPGTFYTETLPAQWNQALREQERLVEAEQRTLEGMRAVQASLGVEVRGEGGGRFFLDIVAGRLMPVDEPAHPPFLTLVQDRADFEQLVAEAGSSALGFLGGLSGLAGEMKLTRAKVEQLAGLQGCLSFEVQGDGGFTLLTHFGAGPVPAEPTARIAVDREAYRALQDGELNPQEAFMAGQIQVEGDLQLAMQIALAALTPD